MSDSIHIKLPDGGDKEFPKGTTALDVAKSISPRLSYAAIVAKARPLEAQAKPVGQEYPTHTDLSDKRIRPTQAETNGDVIDLTRPLDSDTDLRILTEKDPEALGVYRHSSAHLLASAVLELFPETKLGHGPATESGFFYDFYR